ncbi:MAG: hypothetical protein AB1Z98_08980 [Nannocystaceae bacterium]
MAANGYVLGGAGSRFAVVPARNLLHAPTEEQARRLVEAGLHEHGQRFTRQLQQLAQELGGLGHDDPIGVVVDALVRGRLVAVRWDEPTPPLSEAEPIELRELGGGEVIEPMVGGDTREPSPPLQTTWLSFEVVDERGRPVDHGRFEVIVDGRLHVGELLPDSRPRYEPVRVGATAELRLEGLRWDWEPGSDDPTKPGGGDDPTKPSGGDDPPSPAAATTPP